ncbi:murein L,D-transpeptidase catalytic domain-containing protein [Flavitalea flava]
MDNPTGTMPHREQGRGLLRAKWLRYSLLTLAGLVTVALLPATCYYYKGFYRPAHSRSPYMASFSKTDAETARITEEIRELKPFLSRNGYNQKIVFLADMHLPSGKYRFFVYDLSKDSILLAGLVAHGCGHKSFSLSPVYSNISGSSCTSLGKYRIGFPYMGQFGRAYKLYGLDTTNNRAFERNVVLHSYNQVPEGETDPIPICNSRGCAMVAPGFLQRLQPLIDGSERPALLVIFD